MIGYSSYYGSCLDSLRRTTAIIATDGGKAYFVAVVDSSSRTSCLLGDRTTAAAKGAGPIPCSTC